MLKQEMNAWIYKTYANNVPGIFDIVAPNTLSPTVDWRPVRNGLPADRYQTVTRCIHRHRTPWVVGPKWIIHAITQGCHSWQP